MTSERVTLPIENLGCGGGGALTIERALANLDGVEYVYVNPATEMAYVVYDPARSSPARLTSVIAGLGFGQRAARTRGAAPSSPNEPAQWSRGRLAVLAGTSLAAIYALGIVFNLLFPDQVQVYRLWEVLLIGVAWEQRWSLVLGLAEAFLYGALAAWTLAFLARAVATRLAP